MKKLGFALAMVGASCLATMFACEDLPGTRIVLPRGVGGASPGLGVPSGKGQGQECEEGDCRSGLECSAGVCEFSMSSEAGESCVTGLECEAGLLCMANPDCDVSDPLTCLPACWAAGEGEGGDSCSTDLDCAAGLRCGLSGFETVCMESGGADLGQDCVLPNDCGQGLYCSEGECVLPEAPVGVPLWDGIECDSPDDRNVRALFSVPGAQSTPDDADFFQLPFPNDIRIDDDGHPDLSGFPTPGSDLLGFDLVERYVDAIEENSRGWSTNPTVIFRFSGEIDLDSLKGPEDSRRRLLVADVDDLPDTPAQGLNSFGIQYSTGSRTKYVCDDWFALRISASVLVPGHRYIAYFTTDLRSGEGEEITRAPQFEAMLGEDAPSDDPALEAAYDRYAPLREFLDFYEGSDFEVPRDEILTATVFTTEDVLAPMRALRDEVASAEAPKARRWVRCGDGNESPCPQNDASEGRACGSGGDDYEEYQALLSLPIFQEGDAPYLNEGGAIAPSEVRREEVCVSLGVPRQEPPQDGWPLVVYGHGTGGSYRSPLRDEVAGNLSRTQSGFVTLGFDQVEHGPRRGSGPDAERDPDDLFFNIQNPDAARGNPLQGAADVLSVLEWVKKNDGQLATAEETGADAITIDAQEVFLFGHSQGSTHASMALPFSSLRGGVFSGNGGGLIESLLYKKNPVDVARVIPFLIQDLDSNQNLRMGDKHPVLSLLQHYIDPADPVNFAPLLALRPEQGASAKSVFQTFGWNDTYSPPQTLARFIYGAELMDLAPAPDAGPSDENLLFLAEESDPVSGNVGEEPERATLVCRQYEPESGSDGHFVVFDVEEANDDAMGFLSALAADELPVVPAP